MHELPLCQAIATVAETHAAGRHVGLVALRARRRSLPQRQTARTRHRHRSATTHPQKAIKKPERMSPEYPDPQFVTISPSNTATFALRQATHFNVPCGRLTRTRPLHPCELHRFAMEVTCAQLISLFTLS